MRFLTARRLAVAALLPALLVFSVVPGCSNESEGERCGDALGVDSSDCADGLTCIEAARLLNSNGANRCCNAGLSVVNDSRCLPASIVAVGGSGGTAGIDSGGTTSGGTTSGGTAGIDSGGTTSGGTGGTGDVPAAGSANVGAAGAP